MLLDKGAKLDTIVGDRTPLSIAKQEGNPKIITLLKSHVPMTQTFYMISPRARLLGCPAEC